MTRFCKIRSGVGIKVHQTAAIRFDYLVHEISVTNSNLSENCFSSSKSSLSEVWNILQNCIFQKTKLATLVYEIEDDDIIQSQAPNVCILSDNQFLFIKFCCITHNCSVEFVFSNLNLIIVIFTCKVVNASFFHLQSNLFYKKQKGLCFEYVRNHVRSKSKNLHIWERLRFHSIALHPVLPTLTYNRNLTKLLYSWRLRVKSIYYFTFILVNWIHFESLKNFQINLEYEF